MRRIFVSPPAWFAPATKLSSFARTAVAVLFAVATFHHQAAAQSNATTGVIRGVVLNPQGLPVAGAEVSIEHRDTGLRVTAVTSGQGLFVRTLLPLGAYRVEASAEGQLGTASADQLYLRVGETVDLELRFAPVELEGLTVEAGGTGPIPSGENAAGAQRFTEEVVDGLPSNGRNYLDMAYLTPGVSRSQGPDGEVLNIAGQRGIFNNVMVDGGDFNNPFFGEQRGGQRPAFTFNQDAVEELVVVSRGAAAEFGRSAGGFVNVITKSGTNELRGTAHYHGQSDGISSGYRSRDGVTPEEPDFTRSQVGFTLGGPLVRDRAFFFLAYDHQEATETKQFDRLVAGPENLARLDQFLQDQWPGLFEDEFGPVQRTDDARALLAKLDFNLTDRHQASFKYNYSWSEQVNGTFDVDSWGLSSNGVEQDYSHAVNASLRSQLTGALFNELRIQWAREDRPRSYEGPLIPGADMPPQPAYAELGGRPFPDIGMDFADGFRIGLPFFLPIQPSRDTRLQIVDNISVAAGRHLFKAGVEYNRTTTAQQFIGLSNARYVFDSVDGFINFATHGNNYVTCSDGSSNTAGVCPEGTSITGPVLLYLQLATVPGRPAEDLGASDMLMHELAFFVQDTWRFGSRLTLATGIRWEGSFHPNTFIDPEDTFYGPYLGDDRFPSDGQIPDDLDNFQPRFSVAWDADSRGLTSFRGTAGAYYARIPKLVLAQPRTTNGAFQQVLFRSSADSPFLGAPPPIDSLLDGSTTPPFRPDIHVAARDLELPRTWIFSLGAERRLGRRASVSLDYQHSRADQLFRFVDRNAEVFGTPFGVGTHPDGGGIGTLTTVESTARSRYHAVTLGGRGGDPEGPLAAFEGSYTMSWDKSDDDNERDPFTFTYADASRLEAEWGWSDRDRRHMANAYVLLRLPGGVLGGSSVRYTSASPVSEDCSDPGQRAAEPVERICADGTILLRNTLRRDNDLFQWDVRLSRQFGWGAGTIEPVFEMFNITNTDNILDTARGSLLFNFDGTIRSGLGDTRRAQLGVRVTF
ncbi:MAG: TonB-dependent receptor [Gemmatimonadetes bacterium]|nr:TonB-dependent receptor [Gemmatimonadota bacterium]